MTVVLGISLAWATIVAGVFYRLAGAGGGARAESRKQIVVAARPLPVGATIDRESLKMRSVPDSMVPAGAFIRVDDVLDRPVISPIQPDEPVVEARIAAKGSGMGLAPLIPSGMRAISVRVNDVVGVAGFVLPGMRVDVLVTGHGPNRQDTVTRTVLQNIAVLSAGQTIQTDGKSQSIIAPVVTLLVSPPEAESLTLANNEGHIQLVLRNSNDQKVAATHGRQLSEIFGGAAPPEETPAPARPVPRACRRRGAGAAGTHAGQFRVAAGGASGSGGSDDHHSWKSQERRGLRARGGKPMTAAAPVLSDSSWEQRLLRNAASGAAVNPEYQELKFALHRKLLERINLEALAGIDDDGIHSEVREAVLAMLEDEPNLLTGVEKQQISHEVLHEVFGLGPLEPLLQDPYNQRHPGERPPAGLRRAARSAGNDQRAVSRRRPPAAHYRQDRQPGGAAY